MKLSDVFLESADSLLEPLVFCGQRRHITVQGINLGLFAEIVFLTMQPLKIRNAAVTAKRPRDL
jgi:hypothetical protein